MADSTQPSQEPAALPQGQANNHLQNTQRHTTYQDLPLREDDKCPFCYDLLYRPMMGDCGHRFCASCLLRWANRHLPPQPAPIEHDLTRRLAIDAQCQFHRFPTMFTIDESSPAILRQRYPNLYGQRRAEVAALLARERRRTIVVHVGNEHLDMRPYFDRLPVRLHRFYGFFVRLLDIGEVIAEIRVKLVGRGFVPISIAEPSVYLFAPSGEQAEAQLFLKHGWKWEGEDTWPGINGQPRGKKKLRWNLRDGPGAQAKHLLTAVRDSAPSSRTDSDADDDDSDSDDDDGRGNGTQRSRYIHQNLGTGPAAWLSSPGYVSPRHQPVFTLLPFGRKKNALALLADNEDASPSKAHTLADKDLEDKEEQVKPSRQTHSRMTYRLHRGPETVIDQEDERDLVLTTKPEDLPGLIERDGQVEDPAFAECLKNVRLDS